MENVNPMSVPRAEAESLYREYRDALRKKRNDFLHEMKVAYGHMRHGQQIVDVWEALTSTGLDANHDPKIAIAPVDAPGGRVFFVKSRDWSDGQWCGRFTPDPDMARRHYRWTMKKSMDDGEVYVPKGTYAEGNKWAWTYPGETMDANGVHHVPENWREPNRSPIVARVPIVPPRFIPNGSMKGYYILWEVDHWDEITPPKRDPMLLKRINANAFVVIAAWDLTDVERAILRGRLR
jgi:hypothetical protein